MDCERLFSLSDDQFRRSTGIRRTTFEKMRVILNEAFTLKKSKGGRPNKLDIEQQLVMSLIDLFRNLSAQFKIMNSSD